MTLMLQLSFLQDLSRRVKTDADRAAIRAIIGTVQRAQDCLEATEDMRAEIEKRKKVEAK